MRPPQDPEIVRQAKAQDWYIEFDDVNPQAREILEKYSGIAPGDVVQHVKDIRERAIEIFAYPCIGMVKFLDIEISKNPCYAEIKQRLRAGEQYLEVGSCFGQELRQLMLDGVPPSHLHATDLDASFASLGHDLFRDRDRRPQPTFTAADILDTHSSDLERALQGKISIVGASLFFHLFDWAQARAIGARLVGLLAKDRKGLFTGGQVGGEAFERREWLGEGLYVHSEESWRALWGEIGEATGTRWEVETREDGMAPSRVIKGEKHYHIMSSPSPPSSPVQARDGCTIHGQWDSNWVEYANARYRVRIWHDGGDGNLNNRWCDFFYNHGSFVTISNPACWQDGDHAVSDVSYGQGPIGYEQYKKTFWDAFIAMRDETGCQLDVNL